jgi:hypothetical protein
MPVIHGDHLAGDIIHHDPIAFPTLESGSVVYRACPPVMICATVVAVDNQNGSSLAP